MLMSMQPTLIIASPSKVRTKQSGIGRPGLDCGVVPCGASRSGGADSVASILRRIGFRQRGGRQARMRATEIGCRRILTDIDDPFADCARAGEMREQRLAVALADRLGQHGN